MKIEIFLSFTALKSDDRHKSTKIKKDTHPYKIKMLFLEFKNNNNNVPIS